MISNVVSTMMQAPGRETANVDVQGGRSTSGCAAAWSRAGSCRRSGCTDAACPSSRASTLRCSSGSVMVDQEHEREIVDVAPTPVLARLRGADDRVAGLRSAWRVACRFGEESQQPILPQLMPHAQMDPAAPDLQALLAACRSAQAALCTSDLIEVAGGGRSSPSLYPTLPLGQLRGRGTIQELLLQLADDLDQDVLGEAGVQARPADPIRPRTRSLVSARRRASSPYDRGVHERARARPRQELCLAAAHGRRPARRGRHRLRQLARATVSASSRQEVDNASSRWLMKGPEQAARRRSSEAACRPGRD